MFLLIFKYLILIIPALLSVAFLTLLERKILSLVGLRLGPNKVSFTGILQPLSDAFKLGNKGINLLSNFSFLVYYFSSFLMIFFSLLLYSMFFCFPMPLSLKYTFLFLFMILGLNSLNSILSGWSAFSKYSLLGSVRTVSQLISYEGVLYLCFFFYCLIFCCFDFGSFNFFYNPFWGFYLIPCFFIWFPSFLAELNRTPYDFSEGESELVSGFNTEFGSSGFTLIFLAEYGSIFFFCILSCFLFFSSIFLLFFVVIYMVVWFRSILPRFRFDKLMNLSWKFFIPFLTLFFLISFLFLF